MQFGARSNMIIKRFLNGRAVNKQRVHRQLNKEQIDERLDQRKKKGCGCGRKK